VLLKSLIIGTIIVFGGTRVMALGAAGGGGHAPGSGHGGAAVHAVGGGSPVAAHEGASRAGFVSVSSERVDGRNANVAIFKGRRLTEAEKCKVRERHFVEYTDRRGELYCRPGLDKSRPLDCFRAESDPKS